VFSAADKLRIVRKADACIASGERGALEAMLREEGLYSAALSSWRGQLGKQGAAGLEPRKMGRKPKLDAKDRINAQLLKRTAVLERELHIAKAIIDLQKKRTKSWASHCQCSTTRPDGPRGRSGRPDRAHHEGLSGLGRQSRDAVPGHAASTAALPVAPGAEPTPRERRRTRRDSR
jgi:transposase-like protein